MNETDRQKAWRDFMYAMCRSLGMIWLIKALPFVELKYRYKVRDDEFNHRNDAA